MMSCLGVQVGRLYAPAPAFLLPPLPTARTAVRLCAAGEQQWDEERECQEHLHALAQKSAAVNKLREVLRPEGRAALGGDPAGAASVSESEADLDLWDEELEAVAHLREMAAWENEVGKVKAVIDAAEARVAGTATAAQLSAAQQQEVEVEAAEAAAAEATEAQAVEALEAEAAVVEAEAAEVEVEAEVAAQPSGDGGDGGAAPRVFDGVLDAEACDAVHDFATRDGLGHTLYHRDVGPSTPLEAALEAALAALADDAPFVEYWWRDEWKHIEAHADVDEALAAEGGALRYPRNGHVLYLRVGGRVQGPTCVWGAPDGGGATAAGDGELVIVPAVVPRGQTALARSSAIAYRRRSHYLLALPISLPLIPTGGGAVAPLPRRVCTRGAAAG
eukprot:scaffold1007_cov61-Phaeocystis_antarctica.AAC.3